MAFLTSPLLDMYAGENLPGSPGWHLGYGPVIYLSPEQRVEFRVQVVDGLLMDISGRPLDTGNAGDSNESVGRAIYVLDEHGELYCTGRHQHYIFHHSSFVAGAAVACAGEIEVANGVLIYLDNKSGHYEPSAAQLLQLYDYLRQLGVDCPPGDPHWPGGMP